MVPNGSAYTGFPIFAGSGTKSEPPEAKRTTGMVPSDTFPAEWANYLFYRASKNITEIEPDLLSIKKELNTILSEFGITNDASAYDQIVTALKKIYPQICTCSTAAATAAKSVALTGFTIKVGAMYVITMTYGNTASAPTLTINSDPNTTFPICDANGNALGDGAWADGDTITVLFTGAKYLMATRAVVDSVTAGDKSPVSSDAVYQLMSNQFDIMWPKGVTYTQYPGQKDPNELWGDYSTWEELNYGGAFFRTPGGEALDFNASITISSRNGTTLEFTSAHGLQVGSILYDSKHNEVRKVVSVTNTTTVVLDNGFTYSDYTNVLIGQNQGIPEIVGAGGWVFSGLGGFSNAFTASGSAMLAVGGGAYSAANILFNASNGEKKIDGTIQNDVYGKSDNVTPTNFTIKVWKRTN